MFPSPRSIRRLSGSISKSGKNPKADLTVQALVLVLPRRDARLSARNPILIVVKPLLFLFTIAVLSAQTYDLVVYGGTAAGAITAVSGARNGLKVALVETRRHVGGMVSGGLPHSDVCWREVIGGDSMELYVRAGTCYKSR